MESNDLTLKQRIKEEYFKNEKYSLSSNKYFRNHNRFKDSSNILGSLLTTKEFYKLKNFIDLKKILSSFLNKKLMEMVIFGFYKNEKLSIKVMHPVAQQEINFKKKDILFILRQMEEFKDIKEVAVFREDRLRRLSSEFDKDFYEKSLNGSNNENNNSLKFFPERSVAIFENKATDEKIKNKFEEIRKIIKKQS